MDTIHRPKLNSSRTSNRIFIEIPVDVYGTDLAGVDFTDRAITKFVSHKGASLLLARRLGPDQEIVMSLASGREAQARIVGHIECLSKHIVYGVAFLGAEEDFWGIAFQQQQSTTAGNVLLECLACRRREDIALDEIGLAVFEARERLLRDCQSCCMSTFWVPVRPFDCIIKQTSGSKAPTMPSPQALSERQGAFGNRAGQRTCIRQLRNIEVVYAVDISCSGLRFRSCRLYAPDEWIEVAVPYIENAANVFVPAQIAWMKSFQDEKEYGTRYLTFAASR